MPQLQQPLFFLGGISPQQFMRDYWQKKPLLIRQALPSCAGMLTPDELFKLASRDDVESRLVSRAQAAWKIQHGPFTALPRLTRRHWTLLVQGLNLHHMAAAKVMNLFSFLPDARLDDVMASYASPGGGVGPHFDSYDVFLLQVKGQREWQISTQSDLSLEEGLPLKILRHFKPQQTWLLEEGDMLYLPPHVAHNGTAVTSCITCSIGFRAPNYAELTDGFLSHVAETLYHEPGFSRRYADPQQVAVSKPAELPVTMVKEFATQLRQLRWNMDQISQFLGRYLSEPKPHIFFDPPEPLPSLAKFKQILRQQTLVLAPASLALYDRHYFYLNNEETVLKLSPQAKKLLPSLADRRGWLREECGVLLKDSVLLQQVYAWFSYGWLQWDEAGV